MAILESRGLSLELVYRELNEGLWVQYSIYFRWRGEVIVRDDLLKRSPIDWSNRPTGAFMANERDRDSFLPVLNHVLETDKPCYWEPLEPDLIIALYPGMFFPFIPARYTDPEVAERLEAELTGHENPMRYRSEKASDDCFCVVAMIDCYNWKDCRAYQSQGPALVMYSSRAELEAFRDQLADEWEQFRKQTRLDVLLYEKQQLEDAYDESE